MSRKKVQLKSRAGGMCHSHEAIIATHKDTNEYEQSVDDTDGLDEEAEFNAWKVRELTRIKRDREERIA